MFDDPCGSCGADLTHCRDCGEVYCDTCDEGYHEQMHADHEAERDARHAEIDAEYGGPGHWSR